MEEDGQDINKTRNKGYMGTSNSGTVIDKTELTHDIRRWEDMVAPGLPYQDGVTDGIRCKAISKQDLDTTQEYH